MSPIRDLPREAIEEAVSSTWQRALGVERVRRDDDFYELGGHSILAVRTLLDVGEALGVTPHLPSFVGRTTPAAVAETFWELARRRPRP
ncbi:MAG: phosphopantetheine-binding protein [Acidobacteriota bacterium]|nr:phosphopantetheine-binding protein [Acidobacteriota bacterium]